MDSVIKSNALKNPHYAPYCGPCPRLVRMEKIEPLYWRCKRCGAEHDERVVQPIDIPGEGS